MSKQNANQSRRIIPQFTTFDFVLMALLAVANGLLTVFLSLINKLLTGIGGPIVTSTIVGPYMIYGILAIYMIRKPGAAFITFMLGATVQSLAGISYGIAAAYVAAICYAIAVEAVFALFRYRVWNYWSATVASIAAVPLWYLFAAYMFGYLDRWPLWVVITALPVRIASAILLCGILTAWLGNRLLGTGLLKPYAAESAENKAS